MRGGAASLAGLPHLARAAARPPIKAASFSFVHFTDPHIQPELGAQAGVRKALRAVKALPEKPAFLLGGGDFVMDAAFVGKARAESLYDMWQGEIAATGLPLYYTVGNHDMFGLASATVPARPGDPDYGRALVKRRLGLANTYSTFDHDGWRFIILDSVGITPDNHYEGYLAPEQMQWLDSLLRRTDKKMPLVFLTHFPIMTVFGTYTEGTTAALTPGLVVKNGKEFLEMTRPYAVKAVFQGHTHVVEEVSYLGARYITGGAVSGDWWKGKRLGVHPEGFVVATVKGADLTWRYVPYGWDAARFAPKG